MTSIKGIAGNRGAHHVTGVLGRPNNAETERQTMKVPTSFPPGGTGHHKIGKDAELQNKMLVRESPNGGVRFSPDFYA
jgi:hypothetical protein